MANNDFFADLKALIDQDERHAEQDRNSRSHNRLIREVDFKRTILEMHPPEPHYGNRTMRSDFKPENITLWYCECQCPDGMILGVYPCETVQALIDFYDSIGSGE
jgi:hypothetical protein